jgi:hypothetical protein
MRGADLKIGNPRDKSGIIDISRLVIYPDLGYMNVHCLREHRGGDRTGYKYAFESSLTTTLWHSFSHNGWCF